MKNLLVAQSGGPTAVINASLAGVIAEGIGTTRVLGAVHGIEGVIHENFIDLSEIFSNPIKLDTLKHTPASYLGTCRHKLKSNSGEIEKIFEVFDKHNIGYFVYIGGNDSMDTVDKLSKYADEINSDVKIVGVPKTIDNDLAITDHTPGFGSAAKYVATSMREIILDSRVYDMPTLTIVEIMGRNAGWLTAAAALARTETNEAPHFIYLPELPFDVNKFISDIKIAINQYKNVIVAVSEGVKTADGKNLCEFEGGGTFKDAFGHIQLGGAGASLVNICKNKGINAKMRAIELSLLQRSAAHIASKLDADEAELIGKEGAKAVLANKCGIMLYFKRTDNPYAVQICEHKVCEIANAEKKVPLNWIINGNDISGELIEYMKPLINGEVAPKYNNGLPVYIEREIKKLVTV